MSNDAALDGLATVTHARLRAAQGDVGGARRILESVLARSPDDGEARSLLETLSSFRKGDAKGEVEETLAPTGAPEEDREAKVRRLRALLDRIQARGESSDAR